MSNDSMFLKRSFMLALSIFITIFITACGSSTTTLELLAELAILFLGQEMGDELVPALADLRAYLRGGGVNPEVRERLLPGARMQVDRVDQGPVDVEDRRPGHAKS